LSTGRSVTQFNPVDGLLREGVSREPPHLREEYGYKAQYHYRN
jgi:hypothetical protein